MGKKSLKLSKYREKAELLILAVIAFFLYFSFNEDKEKNEENQAVAAENFQIGASNEGAEESKKLEKTSKSVYFDKEVGRIEKLLIKNAKKSIKMATYTYSKNETALLLENKKEEDVYVKVVAGMNKDNSSPNFDFALFQIKSGVYHPKFMVLDSKDVLITSANVASDDSALNNAVLFRDVPVAAKILEDEIDDVFDGKIKKRCPEGCETEIGLIVFNPGKGCVSVKNEFLKAEKSIDAALYTITSKNPVITGLKRALKRNVAVKLVVDNWKGESNLIVNKKAFNYLESLGAKVKYDEEEGLNRRVFHHKFAVIDNKTTIFGSMNWTSAGCYKNREIVVVNRDREIAESFANYLESFANY